MHSGHFTLPVQIDLAATFLFGVTGGLAALKRNYDIIGLFALAFVTGVGGGLLRDGLFIQEGPPAVTKDSRYFLMIVLAGFAALLFRGQVVGSNRKAAWLRSWGVSDFLLQNRVIRFSKLIACVDALGLGAYGVVGVQKSLNAEMSLAAAILVGAINAAGGGLLRDVLVREEPLLFKPGQFYILAAFLGCILFGLLVQKFNMEETTAALITIGSVFLFRMMAIQFNWKSTPLGYESTSDVNPPAPSPAPQPKRSSSRDISCENGS